ncbi:MAG: hypothetical protein CVU16_10745 [Betaproteobacteria bacterium HGW-Betaproteobacteria-10]|nr:MAG: hypothetical protein CVU16_10745 [Betaproteobacteria bacterium HGW-Betaproteobacteria-10]
MSGQRIFPGNTIRSRLIVAFSILLLLLGLVAGIALQHIETLTAGMRSFVDQQARVALLAQEANQQAQQAAIQLLRLLQTSHKERRIPLYRAMDAAMAASVSAIDQLRKHDRQSVDRADIEKVIALREDYAKSIQITVEMIEIDGVAAALAHFGGRTEADLNRLLDQTRQLAAFEQRQMQAGVERLEQSAAKTRELALLIAALAILIGAALAVLIARSIVRPVNEAVAVAESISRGDYTTAIPQGRLQETRALLDALGAMRGAIASREQQITRLAYVDTLTALPNRTRFMEALVQTVERSHGALILLNIDRFAPINNALGFAVGDRMLCEIALRLQKALSGEALVARLGGDEFALLLDGADKARATAQAAAILGELRQPMLLDGQRLDIDASLGIAFYPDDGDSTTVLLRRVELAMSAAKRRHDGYAFAADQADRAAHETLALVGEMREALAQEAFIVYFQPKLDLASRRISGAEALLRWQHPERGLVPPGNFIPFAEQTGFIREITPWLLRQVVAQAAGWRAAGLNVVASVNLSTLDLLGNELVSQIQTLLDGSGLPPELLCLEITESALMDNPEQALAHLEQLAALGVKLSIDDYGSGQASLAYIRNLPVDELKIDRVFVTQVDSHPKNAAIVRSTLLLCRELGLTVVAEGAETADELHWLAANGCPVVQGYGIARPMPADEFVAWVHNFEQATPTSREEKQ